MPTYRKLHTKIVDSYDFAEMPNDFTRVFWMLLIVVVDSEGRAIDNPSWLRSKMFPIRDDVNHADIESALAWLADRGLIVRYVVGGRGYFYIDSFKKHQTGTEKEAKSVLPSPPVTQEQVKSNSGVGIEKVCAAVSVSASASVSESDSFSESSEDAEFEKMQRLVESIAGVPASKPGDIEAIDTLIVNGCTEVDIRAGLGWLTENNKTVRWIEQLVGPANTARLKRVQGANGSRGSPGPAKREIDLLLEAAEAEERKNGKQN